MKGMAGRNARASFQAQKGAVSRKREIGSGDTVTICYTFCLLLLFDLKTHFLTAITQNFVIL